MKFFKKSLMNFWAVALVAAAPLFAQAPADTAAAPATVPVAEVNAELANRDSIMASRDSVCSAEKQALRSELEMEQAKCANWEQSYNTVRRDNEVCAQALSITLENAEKNKGKEEQNRRSSAMAASTSFLSGIGLGLLIMWLIMD